MISLLLGATVMFLAFGISRVASKTGDLDAFRKSIEEINKSELEEEKKNDEPQDKRAQARAALTDLFQSIKTEETPIIVEQVVNDIDNEVVNIVRQFNDAFQSVTARREIKKKLRAILWVKYQIKDNDVFERAYQYIEMYY